MATANVEGKCEKLKTGCLAFEFSLFPMISSPSLKVVMGIVGHENDPTSIRGIAALVASLSTSALLAGVPPPPVSTLEISRGTNAGSTSVKVLDSYDQVWILQSSSDLKTWTDVETLKIHNGNFARRFVADPTRPKLFFRTRLRP
jgi:hypothetical protein